MEDGEKQCSLSSVSRYHTVHAEDRICLDTMSSVVMTRIYIKLDRQVMRSTGLKGRKKLIGWCEERSPLAMQAR